MNIVPVADARQLDAFIRLPFALYQGDPNFVPPLVASEKKMMDPKRNPFYDHAEAAHFLAEKDGRLVGRISAILNRTHNEIHAEKTGFWGYFDCENDEATAKALFDRAGAWLKEKGMTRMLGPANPSLNDPCGLLVDGFKWSPFVLMTYNPGFYVRLVESAGFTKAMDLWAYILLHTELVRDKIDRVADAIQDRKKVTIRFVDLSRFEAELRIIKEIYNDAWEKNWGFVPMTEAEIHFTAHDMKAIVLPELAYIAEVDGKPVGFAFALPDINHALKKCKGSLFPFGWFYFLRSNLRKIPTCRIVALGVKRAYQHMGIGTLFYQKFFEEGLKRGYKAGELSWVLETNDLMNRPIQQMGGKPYKTYRLYERPL
ncbi:MAG TPA: GNAT family N-acetyltransferase [Planctomycetota bacterium]|nr:GNAT family N-acetyltransferase [Planctomycetota bacterium]